MRKESCLLLLQQQQLLLQQQQLLLLHQRHMLCLLMCNNLSSCNPSLLRTLGHRHRHQVRARLLRTLVDPDHPKALLLQGHLQCANHLSHQRAQ